MEELKHYQEIISLGKKLVQEFNAEERRDTTLRWMSHYLAELIAKTEHEKSETIKKQLQKECAEMISNIWKKRFSFPGNSRPLSGLSDLLPVFKALQNNNDDLSWRRYISFERDQPWGEFLNSIRLSMEEMLRLSLIAIIDIGVLAKEKNWLEYKKQLSEAERTLLEYLDYKLLQPTQFDEPRNKASRKTVLKNNQSKTEKVIDLLEENITSLTRTLEKLKNSLRSNEKRKL